ncbi:AAA family ATPase [Cupriavidus sp. SZY C1]|uniref:DUF2813 domain-containing protein n=1 Tax=Cupriavidus sp. SZY C1 TaxID=3055037 RepID=UPI0028BA89AE|nr:AAA family ATPase [Cupriavidus sp. SZY C1]MDT6962248.1 AAA family ATPase [Cupriavidus sp. SZY C1]
MTGSERDAISSERIERKRHALRQFDIANFKGIAQANIEWDEPLVLIGENNGGKSSVLSALACFLSDSGIWTPCY